MSAVRLDQVALRYVDAPVNALDGVTLSADAGEVVWLYGGPGAGCSTLLLVIGGYAPRYTGGSIAGRVTVLDADPQAAAGRVALRGRVAYVTAVPALQLSGISATVWQEVAFAPANLGWRLDAIGPAVERALDRLGISHLAARNPLELSGGELQRVVVAAVAVLEPAVWLLDEPATALDAAGRARLFALLADEAGRGASVIVASEDADAMLGHSHRVVVLERGRVVLDGDPPSILSGEGVWDAGAAGPAIAGLARRAGASVRSARLAPPYPLDVDAAVERWS